MDSEHPEHPTPQSFATSVYTPPELPVVLTSINTAEWTPNGCIYTDADGKQLTPLVQPPTPDMNLVDPQAATIASLQASLAALHDTVAALTATTDTRFNKVAQILAPPRAV